VKHTFTSPVPEGPLSGPGNPLVGPNEWNNLHVFAPTAVSGSAALSNGNDVVFATAGAGGITLTLPTAIGNSGLPFLIWNVDGGAGNVTLATSGGQTINGFSTLVLSNQYQWAEVISNNANWIARTGQG
jgi:hypothetical protein